MEKKIILIICMIGFIFVFLGLSSFNNMDNTGIDGIGEAIFNGIMVNLGKFILNICQIILIIIDNRKYIFTKAFFQKGVILIITIIICVIFYLLITTEKVSSSIPSVSNFEKELNARGFITDNTDYRLYGVSGDN